MSTFPTICSRIVSNLTFRHFYFFNLPLVPIRLQSYFFLKETRASIGVQEKNSNAVLRLRTALHDRSELLFSLSRTISAMIDNEVKCKLHFLFSAF